MTTTAAERGISTDDVLNAGLEFDRTVPRELVHKLAIEEVLLSDYKQLGEDDFVVAGQLPRSHTYLSDVHSPYYDFLVFGEFVRQSALLVSHEFLKVPDDAHYIFRKIGNRVGTVGVEARERLRIGERPTELLLHFRVSNKRVRRGKITSYEISATAYLDGVEAGTGFGYCSIMPIGSYRMIRERMREEAGIGDDTPPAIEPLQPNEVGRRDERNVVLGEFGPGDGESTYTATVAVRMGHPFFFDHPQDHVPGNLLLESFRQMALCAGAARHGVRTDDVAIGELNVEFNGFVELGERATVVAEVGAAEPVEDGIVQVPMEISVRQRDEVCATGDVMIVGRS